MAKTFGVPYERFGQVRGWDQTLILAFVRICFIYASAVFLGRLEAVAPSISLYKALNNRFVGAVVDKSNNWRVIEMIILLGGSCEKQL